MRDAQNTSQEKSMAFAIFRDHERAEPAIHHLHAHGFRFGDIGLAALGPEDLRRRAGAAPAPAAGGAVTGVLGKLANWLVGIGPVFVPGMGSVIAAGPLGAGLRGAFPGVVAGDLLGTLIALGLPEEQTRLAAEAIQSGAVVLAVSAGPSLAEARSVLRSQGGELLGTPDRELEGVAGANETESAETGAEGGAAPVQGPREGSRRGIELDQTRIGSRVYSADGQEMGLVDAVTDNRIRVDRSEVPGTIYVPTDAIDRVEGDRITLRIPSREIAHMGWEETRRKERTPMRSTKEMVRGLTEAQPHEVLGGVLSFLENIPSSAYFLGMAGSILASLGLFITGRRHTALFVGLWVPSIISTALYYKLLHPSRDVQQTLQSLRR